MNQKTRCRIIILIVLFILPLSSYSQRGKIAFNRGVRQFEKYKFQKAGDSFINAYYNKYFPSSEALELAALCFHMIGNNEHAKLILSGAEEEATVLFYLAKSTYYDIPYDSINKPLLVGEVLYDSLFAFYSRVTEYEFLLPDLAPYVFANMYEETEIYDSAVYYADIALKYKFDIDLLTLKADAYRWLSQPDSSKKYYMQALELDSVNTDAMTGIANLYWQIKNPKLALRYINKSLEIDPNDTYALYIKTYILLDLGEHNKAIETTDRMLSVDQNYYLSYFVKGDIYFDLENYIRAIEEYEKYLEFIPDDQDALDNIDAANYNIDLLFSDPYDIY